jgi:hypothetical protein
VHVDDDGHRPAGTLPLEPVHVEFLEVRRRLLDVLEITCHPR